MILFWSLMGHQEHKAKTQSLRWTHCHVGGGIESKPYTCGVSNTLAIVTTITHLSFCHRQVLSVLIKPPPSTSSPSRPSTVAIHRLLPSTLSVKATCSTETGSRSFSSRLETRFEGATSRSNKTEDVCGSMNWRVEAWEDGRTSDLVGG